MSQKDFSGYVYKTVVASQYFPFVSPPTALRYLRQAILASPALLDELSAAGYRAALHSFSPKQVEILEKHLGNIKFCEKE